MLVTNLVACLNNRGLPDCLVRNLNSEFILLPLWCVEYADILQISFALERQKRVLFPHLWYKSSMPTRVCQCKVYVPPPLPYRQE